MRVTPAAVVTGVGVGVAGLLGGSSPAAAAVPPSCADLQPEMPVEPYDATSEPLRLLGIEKAHHELADAREPGAGVAIAVLDSGGHRGGGMDVMDGAVRAVAPERPEDLLADTRHDAVWRGLVGGGVLVVALPLRPVLARRARR